MSWLNALGGIGLGISQGVQDWERMDEAKFRKEQQKRQRDEWEEEDQLAKRLKGIQRTQQGWGQGYEGAAASNAPMMDDEGNAMPGVAQVARPRSKVLADEAAAYLGVANPKLRAQGLTLETAARQLGDHERTDDERARAQAIFSKYRTDFDGIKGSPAAARDWLTSKGLPYYNGKVPDGQRAAHSLNEDGSMTVAFIDEKTNKPVKLLNVPAEQMQEAASRKLHAMMQNELGALSPEHYSKFVMDPEFKRQELGIRQQGADAQTVTAQSNADFHAPGGVWDQAQKAARDAQISVAKIQRSAHGILNPLQQQQLEEHKDYAAKTAEYAKLLADPAANAVRLKQIANELAMKHPEKAQTKLVATDAAGNKREYVVNRFSENLREAFANAGVIELSPEAHRKLKEAAGKVNGDPKRFLNTAEAKAAIKAGLTEKDLLDGFLPKGK